MNAAAFKICTSCTPRYQKPLSLKRRVCPVCGAKGKFAFRAPTDKEIAAYEARRAATIAFIDEANCCNTN